MLHLIFSLSLALADPLQDRGADCPTAQACQALALEAAGRQDYEAFHDLAWRAFRRGKPNDSQLMALLARAQSLSGRPGDALVMLERLLALGVATDAATNDDFRRVRALPGWADFEKRAAAADTSTKPKPADSPISGKNARGRGMAPDTANVAPAESAAAAEPETPLAGDAGEALRFTTIAFTPAGLAYDRVSSRFIVGDRDASKLTVVDEASQRVANLAGAQSAGFGSIGALEIDSKEGDLWVVSSGGQSAPAPTLHKLQLISGRVLYAVTLDSTFGAARFTDIAVTPRSSVLVLDSEGRRLFVAAPRARRLELAMELEATNPTSVAPESDAVAYVAHQDGILRADLAAGRSRPLTAPKSVSLTGVTRLRWHRGALVGVQTSSDGTHRIVRLKLDGSGQRVTSADVLDRSIRMTDPAAAALAGDVFYYLAAQTSSAPGIRAETIVRRVTVK
jgi:hypothetical protein